MNQAARIMFHKVAIPIKKDRIASRFDLAAEVAIIEFSEELKVKNKKIIVLPGSSPDDLSHLILSENINTLICGAIEEEYFQFLRWKKIVILDSVVGGWGEAFDRWQKAILRPGDILCERTVEGRTV